MRQKKEKWLHIGYEVFSIHGESGLKIESISKKVGVSKSSFYHYFADRSIYIQELMDYHIEQSKIIAQKERESRNIEPDLINVLLTHKLDLLFNRQLRINKHIKIFEDTLNKTNVIVGNEFVTLWKKDLNLNLTNIQLYSLFELALENFFLNINPKNLNNNWMTEYFRNLKIIIQNII